MDLRRRLRSALRRSPRRVGLSPAGERAFAFALAGFVVVFVWGWTYALRRALADRPASAAVARYSAQIARNPLAANAPPVAAFALDELVRQATAALQPYGGLSGRVRLVVLEPDDTLPLPDSLAPGARIVLRDPRGRTANPRQPPPGVWNLLLQMRDALRPVGDFAVARLVPLSERRGGRIGGYLVGTWPFERGSPPQPIYRPPSGFIEVTPMNVNLRVSEHFRLGDFLTKGQGHVWPKYVVVSPRLLDKLELTLQELERSGHPVRHVFVVSGFRTPYYNEYGGDPSGRGALSRHMYGDAADIAVDNDRNGCMDDLNGDGRVDVRDARLLAQAAERVEERFPSLVGGIGVYAPTGAYCGFVHIDTRGYRARWGAW